MSLDLAIRYTEIFVALAFIQQSIEHLSAPNRERLIALLRIGLSIFLLCDIQTAWACLGLVGAGLMALNRFNGPYNGGSDRMSLLIICCLCLIHFMPTLLWQELIFGYLAAQLMMSYFIAGWVKIINPEWRSGRALRDVFFFSAYPASESLRGWARRPRILWVMSWAVMLFELLFPFTLLTHTTLVIGLTIAAIFHFSNACFFGFNRFFWIWLAAYPSILWLQERMWG